MWFVALKLVFARLFGRPPTTDIIVTSYFGIYNKAGSDCLNSSCLAIGSTPAWDRGQVRQSVQDGDQSLKWPSIRDQYPRDVITPAGMKNDVNNMRSVEHNNKCNFVVNRITVIYVRCRLENGWQKVIWKPVRCCEHVSRINKRDPIRELSAP